MTKTVYTIGPSLPFVDTLATGVWEQAGGDPVRLARYYILLPTRRSCRSLREAFLRLSDGKPTLLPRMAPIGDVDEDELVLSGDANVSPEDRPSLDLPPAISAIRRQLLLGEMIRKRPSRPTPDQAALLAREMGSLIDQVATERLNFDDLKTLDVGEYAAHWSETLEFLELVTEFWPDILAEEGLLDPAERRNRMLAAQARQWSESPPSSPVIAAGSTGSIPATADLLSVIAELDQGCVVLPGLDQGLDDSTWLALGPTHPQYGLRHLLSHMEVDRQSVGEWPTSTNLSHDSEIPSDRETLIRRAFLPASATGDVISLNDLPTETLRGVLRVDCKDTAQEATVISLIMRETLETPGKTASLVTQDRNLARRVVSELKRWNINIDDSAGVPLIQTPPGTFLLSVADAIAEDLAPVALLALLKHPLTAGGQSPGTFRQWVRELEVGALRGPRPDPGFEGLLSALSAPKHGKLRELVENLRQEAEPFCACLTENPVKLQRALRAHISFAEFLTGSDEQSGQDRLWRGDAGETLARFLADLHDALDEGMEISPRDYTPFLKTLMCGAVVRPRFGRHPRLNILGPLEARLQHADHIILGGLNEGVWPPEPQSNPWMSRPMMTAFGLPVPERRIGLSAHDFVQAFCAGTVTLTRSERVDGVPTVPSRWLRRLDNLVTDTVYEGALKPDPYLTEISEALDRPESTERLQHPAPKPPVSSRPRQLSVTRIRTLQRDPYAIYARSILKLEPLKSIDAEPGPAERGIIIHDILDRFIRKYPRDLPDNAEAVLVDIGRDAFARTLSNTTVAAFWWPRFQRIAEWFIDDEQTRRANGEFPAMNDMNETTKRVASEIDGCIEFDAPGGLFRLRARADRVNSLPGGGLAVIDYKTGQTPTAAQAETGLEPQLPLEAAMIHQGAFKDVPRDEVHRLTYIRLTGGRIPGEVRNLKLDVGKVAADTWENFKILIAGYDNPDQAYLPHVRPMTTRDVGDYDHLARVREWLLSEDDP